MTALDTTAAIETGTAPPAGLQRGVAFGFLALLPLFVVYEITLRSSASGTTRNAAEVVLGLPLSLFGAQAGAARLAVLCACTALAVWTCFHAQLGLFARIARVIVEGALGAILLGPVLLMLQHALHLSAPVALSASGAHPIAVGLFHFSGAAFEEIVFRVGLQSALWVLGLELVLFFTDSRAIALALAECGSILVAALVFAAAHLVAFVRPLGAGGDVFDPSVFAWRVLAGVLLGVLYRWRGPGVAGWTHGLFNLALFIGAGPDVFL